MQPDPLSPQEIKQPEPYPIQETKAPKRSLTAIILAVFLVFLLAAFAGLGFWAYTLNSKLTAAQQNLTSLKGEHDKLQLDYATLRNDNEKLTSDFDQTKGDLEKSQGDFATAQADLKKSQDQNKGNQSKIDVASEKLKVLHAYTLVEAPQDIFAIDSLIKATNDNQLLTEWNNFTASPSGESSLQFLIYLINSIQDDLK